VVQAVEPGESLTRLSSVYDRSWTLLPEATLLIVPTRSLPS